MKTGHFLAVILIGLLLAAGLFLGSCKDSGCAIGSCNVENGVIKNSEFTTCADSGCLALLAFLTGTSGSCNCN